ncbi:DUF502 domain-containing protein [Pectinatus cerevisiiphilus]|uniref:Putative membrane protein n=1 Tax=Pectinatus cerevisiiphilus TaxID=86956 RepID=A0A4R3K1I7_9FIRM|nr:DUF502 domain-containing protein [Pectinatus cerevisiiphilus]TCS75441.1 putative membrane protein [Pectinatus cerevisiiphilus]
MKKLMNKLSKCFINGIMIITPIFITYLVISTVWLMVDGLIGHYIPIKFPGMGIIIVVFVIIGVGWLSSNWISKRLISWGEGLIARIPIVKFIYSSVKRLSDTIFKSGNMFENAVLVPYPHPGVRCLGFVMTPVSKKMAGYFGDEEYLSVFIPWSLNMTSGFNVFIPKKDVTYIDIQGEDALQYIITAGAVMPGNTGKLKGDK